MSEKPPTAEKIREYLTPGQHRRVQMANRSGEQLSRLLAVLQTEDHELGEFNPKVDVDVRGCLERLRLHQDLLSRCEEYEVQVAVEFTIQAEDFVSTRRLVAFLDHDRRSEIGHHAYLLRCWIGVCMDWLIVAARQRGIMIEGNQIDERTQRQLWYATHPSPASAHINTSAVEPSASLNLLFEHARPQPPEPPHARIQAAALQVAEAMSAGRSTDVGEREFLLSGLAGLSRRKDAVPVLDTNGYRWAVRRLIEAGLVTVVMADPPPVVRLSDELGRKRSGLPARDASGRHVPQITTPRPQVPHLRSTPELWERWRGGCIFPAQPTSTQNGRKKSRNQKATDTKKANLDQLQRLVVGFHRPNTSNSDTATRAAADERVQRLAKDLGKRIDEKFVQSCRTAQRAKEKSKGKSS